MIIVIIVYMYNIYRVPRKTQAPVAYEFESELLPLELTASGTYEYRGVRSTDTHMAKRHEVYGSKGSMGGKTSHLSI